MGRNVGKKETQLHQGKEEKRPQTPSSKEEGHLTPTQLSKLRPRPKPKPNTNPKPSPLNPLKKPNKQNEPNEKNEKEVEHSMPMKELSNTQIKNMLGQAGKSPALSNTQYEFPVDGSPSRGQAKSSAVIQAQEVRSKLEPRFPSFVKSLVRSHVASCFWMGLPSLFCKSHLPDKDITMTLEDESGRQCQLKYIAYKTGLSAGWRQFAASHNLIEGDVLVFQLVEPTKFKVYIIRSNDLTEVDGALGLLNLDSHSKGKDADKDNPEMDTVACNDATRKRAHSPPSETQKKKKIGLQPVEQSEDDSEEVDSEVLEESKSPDTALHFEDIQSFENFSIIVNGLLVDSELPKDVRRKYYKLCCSQNAFLHKNVIEGMNHKLVVGAISETVNIADAIKACKLTTTRDDFVSWDKYLKAFELLGMNVGFLRDRLCRLANLSNVSEAAVEARMYKEAKIERSKAGIGIRNIEVKLEELRDVCDEFGAAIESLRSKAEVYTLKFHEEVTAPW